MWNVFIFQVKLKQPIAPTIQMNRDAASNRQEGAFAQSESLRV